MQLPVFFICENSLEGLKDLERAAEDVDAGADRRGDPDRAGDDVRLRAAA
jgi:hypothetical protein